jgi:hypothetical protein
MNTTSTIDPLILSFAEAVRAQLDDLPAEEADDLTEGLEADLTEQAADAGAPSLGDPVEYAAELRSAAGLPAREFPVVSLWAFEPVIEWWARVRAATGRVIHSNPVIASVAHFLVSLRPVWWLARGWAFFLAAQALFLSRSIEQYFPTDVIGAAVFIPLVVLSVQWGRGKWMPRPWLRVAHVLASIAAVIVMVLFAGVMIQSAQYRQYDDVYVTPLGLTQEGESITNIFAYGPDGEPIADVRLFDQNGTPISVVGSYDPELYPELLSVFDGSYRLVPNYASPDGSIWDIYPLRQGHVDENGEIDPTQPTTDARSPFDRLLPLQGAEPAPTTTPAPLR